MAWRVSPSSCPAFYSDRLEKRKPLAVIGYFVAASGMASFALATRWWHVLLGRVGG
jgi:hypothetical protein